MAKENKQGARSYDFNVRKLDQWLNDNQMTRAVLSKKMGRHQSYLKNACAVGHMSRTAFDYMCEVTGIDGEWLKELDGINIPTTTLEPVIAKADFENLAKFVIDIRRICGEVGDRISVLDSKVDECMKKVDMCMESIDECSQWRCSEAEQLEKIQTSLNKDKVSLHKIREALNIPPSPAD